MEIAFFLDKYISGVIFPLLFKDSFEMSTEMIKVIQSNLYQVRIYRLSLPLPIREMDYYLDL